MKHLRLFETEAVFDTAKENLPEPWVTLIEDVEKVHFMDGGNEGGDEQIPQSSQSTRWYNGDTLIKEIDVIGELTNDYKELNCTRCEIGTNVTSIGEDAFQNCNGLTSITIPNSITSIGEYAFAQCRNLTNIEIPNSVTSIGGYAFQSCNGLTSVTIPNSVTDIGEEAFNQCENLTSITIPNSVTSIGDFAFFACYSLTSVTISHSVTYLGEIPFVGETPFEGCRNLTNLIYADGCTEIIQLPLFDITSITIPNSVTSIGEYAFQTYSSLTSVNYNGTIEQWNAITKGNGWNNGVPSTCIVHCTDGDISISNA